MRERFIQRLRQRAQVLNLHSSSPARRDLILIWSTWLSNSNTQPKNWMIGEYDFDAIPCVLVDHLDHTITTNAFLNELLFLYSQQHCIGDR